MNSLGYGRRTTVTVVVNSTGSLTFQSIFVILLRIYLEKYNFHYVAQTLFALKSAISIVKKV